MLNTRTGKGSNGRQRYNNTLDTGNSYHGQKESHDLGRREGGVKQRDDVREAQVRVRLSKDQDLPSRPCIEDSLDE